MWTETPAEMVGRYFSNIVDFGINLLPGSSFPEVGRLAGEGNYGAAAMALGSEFLGPLGKEARGIGALGREAEKSVVYSVAFETTIEKLGAGTRASHFSSANKALIATMQSDAAFAKSIDDLGIKIDRMDRSPAGWSWHHVPDQPGVMQLIPRAQHQGGAWQSILQPDQVGGFKLWGADF